MAEATITHFREFDRRQLEAFGERVRLVVGEVVYGLKPEEVQPETATIISNTAGPGSYTSASAGTEVKVDLAEEVWPLDPDGKRADVEAAIAKAKLIGHAIGVRLLGGVAGIVGHRVNVWSWQFAATGWFGPDTEV